MLSPSNVTVIVLVATLFVLFEYLKFPWLSVLILIVAPLKLTVSVLLFNTSFDLPIILPVRVTFLLNSTLSMESSFICVSCFIMLNLFVVFLPLLYASLSCVTTSSVLYLSCNGIGVFFMFSFPFVE